MNGIVELSLIGVAEPGVANKERIALRPTQLTNLAGFGIAVGIFDPATGGARLPYDQIFWFPEFTVSPPSWILLYTCAGTPQAATSTEATDGPVHTFFWQRPTTIFGIQNLVPVLVKIGGATVGGRLEHPR